MCGVTAEQYAGDTSAEAYMEKAAARVGDKTEHGPTLKSGSPDVNINGKAAWRANVDELTCDTAGWGAIVLPVGSPIPAVPVPVGANHGPEIVKVGSNMVRINGQDAVRRFDVAVGGGPPNAIVEGSPNVHFGERGLMGGIGMDDDAMAAEWCEKLCALLKKWPGMTPAERRAGAEELIHWLQDRAGLPPVRIQWGDGAFFVEEDWTLTLPKATEVKGQGQVPIFEQSSPGPNLFGGNAYHETRHAQQYYMALRYRIAKQNLDYTDANVDRIAAETMIPPEQVRRAFEAPRYAPGSDEYRYGELMDKSLIQPGGFSPAYHLQAHERDARMVGYRGDCFRCCDPPAT